MGETSEIVEFLRAKMIRVANSKQCFTDAEVVAISQLLDRFIVQAQRVASVPQPPLRVIVDLPQYAHTSAQSFAYTSRPRAVQSRS